ncbi:MAG TPA: cadherin repeat domain-containing protein, partial [Paludibacteraceae bacterium]|nr:cadherin repeat domain-containing protein [Paludibacteraceae bacterium]
MKASRKTGNQYNLKKSTVLVIIFILFCHIGSATKYYVATNGNDSNSGAINSPFANWEKLGSVLAAGDTAFIRGGTYRTAKSASSEFFCLWNGLVGTQSDSIKIWAYPGETPIFNLDNITPTHAVAYGICLLNSQYIYIKGLRVTGLAQNVSGNIIYGINTINSGNCKIEKCEVDHIGGYGFAFSGTTHKMIIKNCDTHHLDDLYSSTPHGGSNGFSITGDNSVDSITFYGCRAWFVSDDGWDFYGSDGFFIIDNCWSFWNGYDENFNILGDGSGYKLGPASSSNLTSVKRIIRNSLAVENRDYGFNCNEANYNIPMNVYNNTSYKQSNNTGFNFAWGATGAVTTLRNNISYLDHVAYEGKSSNIQDHNTWNGGVTVSNADFVGLDSSQLLSARQSNGNLPTITFLHLSSGSDLIDAGTNVGLPYYGTAPDMGTFEFNSYSNQPPVIQNQSFQLNENSPNGTVVGTVVATDPNAGQTLTYSILSGNTNDAFSINSSTGVLSVNSSSALNYEVTPSFALVVKVQDNGNPPANSQATITVALLNVNEPPIAYDQTFNVIEASANGTIVGYVGALDPDAGQTLSWAIISGNTSNAFAINSTTGALSVNNSSALNYQTNPIFNLIVRVTEVNGANLFDDASVSINVLQGTNQAPVILNQSFSINENSSNGTLVGNVAASDPDAGQTLTYSILSGNTGSAFAINASTGAITVNTSSVLNY